MSWIGLFNLIFDFRASLYFYFLITRNLLHKIVSFLRCPVTQNLLQLQTLEEGVKFLDGKDLPIIENGILYGESGWIYPVINGLPRLMTESFLVYEDFLRKNLLDYDIRKNLLLKNYKPEIEAAINKNRITKKSFTEEWKHFDIEQDKIWNAGSENLLDRFLTETNETLLSLKGKLVLDAGCGNGKLNCILGDAGIENFAVDFSEGITGAYHHNRSAKVYFIEADINHPPFAENSFDLIQCSGVLIHTKNTRESFAKLVPYVKPKGKLSVWLYHKRKNILHNTFNKVRNFTSRWPLKLQVIVYRFTLYPISFIIKRLKGNKQNSREMFVEILDWFTPQYRWEHTEGEVIEWFSQEGFINSEVTDRNLFGFNMTGIKK